MKTGHLITGDRRIRGAPGAVRIDRAAGIREEVGFFGSGEEKMFGCAHRPLDRPPTGAVVICPSIHAEVIANYRREVLVARALAACGFAVQRFQFRGTGHSDGESSELTFETMRRDAMDAACHLLAAAGPQIPAFVGTRWGAMAAAGAASGFPGAPLALWEPIVMPARWFREMGRAERIRGLAGEPASSAGESTPVTGERGVIERLRDGETVDILGYPIDPALHASSADRSLAAELGGEPRSVLIIQLARARKLRGEYRELVARWGGLGFDVEAEMIPEDGSWWFHDPRPAATEALGRLTIRWLRRRVPAEVLR